MTYTLSIKSEVVKPPKDYAQTVTHLEVALDEAQYAIVRLAILKALHDAAQPPIKFADALGELASEPRP